MDDDFYDVTTSSYSDWQFMRANGNILFLALMPFILWYFLWKLLAAKSRNLGIAYLASSALMLGGGIAWTQVETQHPSTYNEPRCEKTRTCNYLSNIPLHEQ